MQDRRRTGTGAAGRAPAGTHGPAGWPGPDAAPDHGDLLHTPWGYVLVSGGPVRRHLLVAAEVAVQLGAVALGVMALALWVGPGTPFDPGLMGHRITATVLFAMGGLVLWRYATQGFQTEAHLDRLRGEIRIMARTRRGHGRLIDCIAFADITAVSVDRAPRDPSRGRLMLHAGKGSPLPLLSGPAVRLSPLAAMIARDITRARETEGLPLGALGRLVPAFG